MATNADTADGSATEWPEELHGTADVTIHVSPETLAAARETYEELVNQYGYTEPFEDYLRSHVQTGETEIRVDRPETVPEPDA